MPADIDPNASPDALAVCPRRLLNDERMPRCRALVLARYADEHETWHDQFDAVLDSVLTVADNLDGGVSTVPWPGRAPQPAEPHQL